MTRKPSPLKWTTLLLSIVGIAYFAFGAAENSRTMKFEYISIIDVPQGYTEVITPTERYRVTNSAEYSTRYIADLCKKMNLTLARKAGDGEYELTDLFNAVAQQGWELVIASRDGNPHDHIRYILKRAK